jgi:mono/diheme cytochrome c family protein
MIHHAHGILWFGALAGLLSLGACGEEAPSTTAATPGVAQAYPGVGLGKTDVFGRSLTGIAAEYQADLTLSAQEQQLKTDMAFRRQIAWEIVGRVIDPVPLLGLADAAESNEDILLPEGEVPTVPRYQTWYGVDDFKRMFRELFSGLGPAGRAARQSFSQGELDTIFAWNAEALDRSERWPLERFLKYVKQLGVCPPDTTEEACALTLQSQFSGATSGNSRIAYSPGTMRHMLDNYGPMLECLETLTTTGLEAVPTNADQNFSACFSEEMPADAVLIKAHWVRSDFGRKLPAFDTHAQALQDVMGEGRIGDWAAGDREVDPSADEIVTIKMKSGDTYRLAGLHIMTKELRHWVWVTLWWSDSPEADFGADRPEAIRALEPVWSNYKMGVVVDYLEGDPDPAARFEQHPSLAASIAAAKSENTWMSNPYIEHGGGNAKTNCIGCHQHGGSIMGQDLDSDGLLDPFDLELVIDSPELFPANGRTKIRSLFPADYLWSTSRVDSISQVVRSQVENFDYADTGDAPTRAAAILELDADIPSGSLSFQERCTPCHGTDGNGTSAGPSLFDRVPTIDDQTIAETLLLGKSPMPSWSHLADPELANLRAFVRDEFGL